MGLWSCFVEENTNNSNSGICHTFWPFVMSEFFKFPSLRKCSYLRMYDTFLFLIVFTSVSSVVWTDSHILSEQLPWCIQWVLSFLQLCMSCHDKQVLHAAANKPDHYSGHLWFLSLEEVRVFSQSFHGVPERVNSSCGQVLPMFIVSLMWLFSIFAFLGMLCSPNQLLEHSKGNLVHFDFMEKQSAGISYFSILLMFCDGN